MVHCTKQIDSNSINDMDYNAINNTLASCEQNCPYYYHCNQVAWMNDRLKELEG